MVKRFSVQKDSEKTVQEEVLMLIRSIINKLMHHNMNILRSYNSCFTKNALKFPTFFKDRFSSVTLHFSKEENKGGDEK